MNASEMKRIVPVYTCLSNEGYTPMGTQNVTHSIEKQKEHQVKNTQIALKQNSGNFFPPCSRAVLPLSRGAQEGYTYPILQSPENGAPPPMSSGGLFLPSSYPQLVYGRDDVRNSPCTRQLVCGARAKNWYRSVRDQSCIWRIGKLGKYIFALLSPRQK